jgi:hypothetical protein
VHLHVRADDDRVWARLLELARDPDLAVRSDVIHAITDSAPAPCVPAVSQALESRHNDPDVRIRRQSARPSPKVPRRRACSSRLRPGMVSGRAELLKG